MPRERGQDPAGPPDPSVLGAAEAASAILEAVEAGERVVLIQTLPDGTLPRRRIVTGSRTRGSLGSEALDRPADTLAAALLDGSAAEGRHALPESGVPVYAELHLPTPELVIVGAGHIARPLAEMGRLLEFRVRVLDDRPEFATRERFPGAHQVVRVDFSDPFADVPVHGLTHLVLVTRGHKYDYECLRRILRSPVQPRYVGLIGSRRRVRATLVQLLDEGIPRERLATLRAPLGLDLGAQTPAEIAVAVAAELVLSWRGGSGRPLREVARVLDRFLPPDAEPAEEA